MNINLFFCEGPHDMSFLVRLLKDNGHIDYSDKPISDIPDKDLQKIVFNSLNLYKYDETKNIFAQKPTIPSILFRDDQCILIYSTNGHLNKNADHPADDIFLRIVKDFISIKKSEIFKDKVGDIRISLFYDADESMEDKLRAINKYLTNLNLFEKFENLDHKKIIILAELNSLGCFIFKTAEQNDGCLEDILIPILLDKHEAKVLDSYTFLDTHFDKLIKQKHYDRKKATIGVIGQLEKSGVANNSIIGQTSFFKGQLITPACIEVYDFINDSLKS